MSPNPFISHWRGLLLTAAGAVATLLLSLDARLDWYLHPRNMGFAITMAAIAAIITPAAAVAVWRAQRRSDRSSRRSTRGALQNLGNGVLVMVTAGALLLLPPATLSTATASQRVVNASIPLGEGPDDPNSTGYGVREWAALLAGPTHAQVTGQQAAILGFVTPDPELEDVFYVTRFIVTHCIVDAQPVGVPVYLPGWNAEFGADAWVRIEGAFVSEPAVEGAHPVVLLPMMHETVEQPENPYVF